MHPCARAVTVLVGLWAAQAALAQTEPLAPPPDAKLDRVVITGSSIKRIEGENALPVQVITREDIDKSGATTAAELVKSISANTAPLSDGASITNVTNGQRGFNGANLRGIGVSSTLVLLNGRRLANFATPGDNAGVDLNNIPAAAIDRVEVLKDGASAIYGTDAIGGVINFITKKNYQGIDVSSYAANTQEGGAGKRTLTFSAGVGDIEKDKYNLLAVLDVQQLGGLRSIQRQFIQDRPLAETLPAFLSSIPFPANARRLTRPQWDAFKAAGLTGYADAPYSSSRRVNPAAPDCSSPASVYTPNSRGGAYGCSYDYMRDTELYPASDKTSLFARGTVQLNDTNQMFVELMQSKADTTYRYGAYNANLRNVPTTQLPTAWQNALTTWNTNNPTRLAGNTLNTVAVRLLQAGGRTDQVTSDGQRIVVGMTGAAANWDYDLALARAKNRVSDRYVGGYLRADQFFDGVAKGQVSLFAYSDASRDFLKSITVNDEARLSSGTTESFDGKISRPLFNLAGGEAAIALGAEFRRESNQFTPSDLLVKNYILGDRNSEFLPGEVDPTVLPFSRSRNVSSLYAELSAPFAKTIETQFAVRYDSYQGVGDTVNPKAGIRWAPSKNLLVRTSVGTGFRAPSLSDLNRPVSFGGTSSLLTDPTCVTIQNDIDSCTDIWEVERRSNPKLKPEKSRQFSLGSVLEVTPGLTLSMDYWKIEKTDVISDLGEQEVVQNGVKYEGQYIFHDVDGYPTKIILTKENQGQLKTSGLDIGVDWRGPKTSWGRFAVGLQGTLVLQYDRQYGAQTPMVSELGVFANDQIIQKWRHRLTLDWDSGPYGVTLGNSYSSDYQDQNLAYDQNTNALLPARRVQAYSLWDLTGSWKVNKALRLRGGVMNVLNTPPPFSNQSYHWLATYDPTYTDPRGRTAFVSLSYAFK